MRKRFWVLPALLLLLLVGWLVVGWLIAPDGNRPSLDVAAFDPPDVVAAPDQPARNPLPALPDSDAQVSPADTPVKVAGDSEVADAPQPDKPLEYRLHVEALIVDENGVPLEGYQPHVIRNVSIVHGEWTDLGRIDLAKASHSGDLTMK